MDASAADIRSPRRPARMQFLNFVIDVVTLLVVLAMAATGLLLEYVLPPGRERGHGLQLWGYTRHDWGEMHFWLAVGMGVLFIIHVALHWTWICTIVGRTLRLEGASRVPSSKRRRSLLGVGFLLTVSALLAGFVWVAAIYAVRTTVEPERGARGFRGGRNAAMQYDTDSERPRRGNRSQQGAAYEP